MSDAMQRRISHLRERHGRLQGSQQALVSRKADVVTRISDEEGVIHRNQQVTETLYNAQERLQAKTRDAFEELLTRLLHDVMPETQQERVSIESGISAGRPTVDFTIDSGGDTIDVTQKGGSVRNILSMGLRFLTIARSPYRRLLLLDEADCWLNPSYVPAFARVMRDVASNVGAQVLYITHHDDPSYFEGLAQRIHLVRDDKGRVVVDEDVSDPPHPWSEGQQGVRSIRLRDFKGHGDTVIELSPGVNVITGDNDIGKSSIAQAIQALRFNAGTKGLIRKLPTRQPHTTVELGIEGGQSLVWTYRRSGSKNRKATYQLFGRNGDVLASAEGANETPEFLDQVLAMPKVEGVDIHHQDQNEPTFMIDNSVTAPQRAQLLALGQKAIDIQKMLREQTERTRHANRARTDLMRQLKSINAELEAHRGAEELGERLSQLSETAQVNDASRERIDRAQSIADALDTTYQRRVRLEAIPKERPTLAAPTVKDTHHAERIGHTLALHARRKAALKAIATTQAPEPPQQKPLDALIRTGKNLAIVHRRRRALAPLVRRDVPKPPDASERVEAAQSAGERLSDLVARKKGSRDQLKQTEQEKKQAEASLQSLKEEIGLCPLCGSSMNADHTHDNDTTHRESA